MPLSICTLILLIASAAAFIIPQIPSIVSHHLGANHSQLEASLANATKSRILRAEWPELPFKVPIGGHLTLNIDTYGRKASIPRFSTIILDSIESIIYNLDIAGRPLDLIAPLELASYNGLVKVKFGANGEEQSKLTRLDASEVLSNVWDLTAKYGPREIVLAEIEERSQEELIGLFVLVFPGPVLSAGAAKGMAGH